MRSLIHLASNVTSTMTEAEARAAVDAAADAWNKATNALASLMVAEPRNKREAAERLHLPFPLLSDAQLAFASAMRLPQFDVGPMRLLKRLTLIVRDGVVEPGRSRR